MEKTRGVIGSPVRGSDLWDRELEIKEIWKALETGSVLLVAPRRFGKTSIMLKLMDAPRNGYRVFYLDTEWIKGPADFIAELATELLKDNLLKQLFSQIDGFFSNVVNRIKGVQLADLLKIELREEIAKDWRDKGMEFISQLKKVDENIVLIVDELPLMIQKMLRDGQEEAEDFLYWMRGIRQMPELSNVRFVIGGSIGIEHILNKAGTGTKTINDLLPIQVGPFPEDDARKFIEVLLRNDPGLNKDTTEVVGDFIDILETPIPYFIQILVSESIREAENQRKPLSAEVIRKAYDNRVLASYNRTYFEHYYTRLQDHYKEDEKLAKAILLEIAKRTEVPRGDLWKLYQDIQQGTGNEEEFSYLLSDLENDFYIQFDSAKRVYRFATKVLRDWWLRHHAITD